ncbi:conserved hypothetical protein [Vibrio crassostreae]|nr:conserved hypothetical protein [Vibrio crassostreae]
MQEFIKDYILQIVVFLMVCLIAYMLIANPLGFTDIEIREFALKAMLYSITAIVAVLGYWWTQIKQDERHNDNLFEERWNKTLDIKKDALVEMCQIRANIERILANNIRYYIFKFIEDHDYRNDVAMELRQHCNKIMDMAEMFLSDNENEEVSTKALDINLKILDMEDCLSRWLPIPNDDIEAEAAIADLAAAHLKAIIAVVCELRWEIQCEAHGLVIQRYDINRDDDEQFDGYLSKEEYIDWKKGAEKERKMIVAEVSGRR